MRKKKKAGKKVRGVGLLMKRGEERRKARAQGSCPFLPDRSLHQL